MSENLNALGTSRPIGYDIISVPGKQAHWCNLPDDDGDLPRGSIVRCSCGDYYLRADSAITHQLEWKLVRWWNFRVQHRIRKAVNL